MSENLSGNLANPSKESSDLEKLIKLRNKYPSNPLIAYLNINSLRNKIIDLKEILGKALPDILVLAETKLSNEFPTRNFIEQNYQFPIRKDRNEHGGGLMQFNRKGVICNRIQTLESEHLEMLSTELTVNKKKWIIFSIYRPPVSSNLKIFFREISLCMNKALEKYDNVIVMGDINIDWQSRKHPGYDDLKEFCDVFALDNLVKENL